MLSDKYLLPSQRRFCDISSASKKIVCFLISIRSQTNLAVETKSVEMFIHSFIKSFNRHSLHSYSMPIGILETQQNTPQCCTECYTETCPFQLIFYKDLFNSDSKRAKSVPVTTPSPQVQICLIWEQQDQCMYNLLGMGLHEYAWIKPYYIFPLLQCPFRPTFHSGQPASYLSKYTPCPSEALPILFWHLEIHQKESKSPKARDSIENSHQDI